jgi:hypothetical protein
MNRQGGTVVIHDSWLFDRYMRKFREDSNFPDYRNMPKGSTRELYFNQNFAT